MFTPFGIVESGTTANLHHRGKPDKLVSQDPSLNAKLLTSNTCPQAVLREFAPHAKPPTVINCGEAGFRPFPNGLVNCTNKQALYMLRPPSARQGYLIHLLSAGKDRQFNDIRLQLSVNAAKFLTTSN